MVTPRFAPEVGGVERHVEEVAARAAAAGWEVTVLTTDRTGELPEREHHRGFEVVRVRAWPADRDYHFAPGLLSEIGRREWSVVHVQSYHTLVAPIAMLAAVRARVPFVVTFHGGGHSSAMRHSLRALQRRLLRPLLRRATALVAIAAFEVDAYAAQIGVDRDRFELIPNGVDPVEVDDDAQPAAGGTLIASVGRLERYKGHHRVLAALPHVLEERPDARLWIAGDGPFEASLRAQAARLGVADRVEIGAVSDRTAFNARLRQAAVVALLSDFETHPLAVLEAAALGRRVVVADNSGLREVAARGLARAIPTTSPPEAVARALLEELDAAGPVAGVDLPTWDDCASALMALYHRVATERSPSPWVAAVGAPATASR